MSFVRTLLLKFRELLSTPVFLVVLLLMPVLLGLVAGEANLANRSPDISLAVVDLDGTDMSQKLVSSLARQGFRVRETEEQEINRLLTGQAVDGALVIKRGFDASLATLLASRLTYTPAAGTLSANLILDTISTAVIPFKSRSFFMDRGRSMYTSRGVPLPQDYEERFDTLLLSHAQGDARQEFLFANPYEEAPALTYVVNDYSMEVLFLGLYALLGSLALSSPAMAKRLKAARYGLLYDDAASLIALYALGTLQILLYMLSMRLLMATPFVLRELWVLCVFLLMSLALGQGLTLFHQSIRMYLGLVLNLLLCVTGGCFLQLPQTMIASFGQYIPQGWALAALRHYPVPHTIWPIGLSWLFIALIHSFRRRETYYISASA